MFDTVSNPINKQKKNNGSFAAESTDIHFRFTLDSYDEERNCQILKWANIHRKIQITTIIIINTRRIKQRFSNFTDKVVVLFAFFLLSSLFFCFVLNVLSLLSFIVWILFHCRWMFHWNISSKTERHSNGTKRKNDGLAYKIPFNFILPFTINTNEICFTGI